MNVQPLSSTTTSSDPKQQSLSGLTGDSFLTLLTAQLKSQDPTSPTDPTQFMGQLVEFNSLEQLIQINQNLKTILGGSAQSAAQNTAVQNTAPKNQTLQNVIA